MATYVAIAQRRDILNLGDIFAFAAPALEFVQFRSVGILLATDLLVLAALPIAIIRHFDRLKQKPVPTLLTLGSCWLLAQIATDFVTHSAPEDYLRGWVKITLILVNLIVLWTVVCRTKRRFVLYAAGAALGGILTFFLSPSDQMIGTPWKFGLGIPTTMLVTMMIGNFARRQHLRILVPMTVLAVAHVFENFRSMALICVLTAVYCSFEFAMAGSKGQFKARKLLLLAAGAVLAAFSFTGVYSYYAKQGAFGDYARLKLEAQSGEGGLLLGGRGEVLASGKAILDSPLLGHGSWAKDPTYSAILSESRRELGYKKFQAGKGDDLIPAHSHIFGAWVEAGMPGALFWLFVLWMAVSNLFKASGREPLLPFFAFAGILLTWDILFSPISPDRRFITPYFIAAMILLKSFEKTRCTLWEGS
jgi:hypothetical protein